LEKNKEENLEKNRSIAFENSEKIHEQNKKYYDQNVKEIEYNEDDLVYIQNSNNLNRGKLEVIRSGPHRIKKKVSNVIYVIDSGFKKKESNLFHASKLVPYRDDGNPLPKK